MTKEHILSACFDAELIDSATLRVTLHESLTATAQDVAISGLCALLARQYETPVKLVVLEFDGAEKMGDGAESRDDGMRSVPSARGLEICHDILLEAPYFSLASVTGQVQGPVAAMALFC